MKKHGPNEGKDKNSRKITKQNGDKKSIKYRVQNTDCKYAQRI